MTNFKIDFKSDLLKNDGFKKWKRLIFQNINEDIKNIYNEESKEAIEEIKNHVKSKLKIKSKALLKTIKYKIYDKKNDRLPGLLMGTKQFIFLSHNENITIKSKNKKFLAVPFKNFKGGKRIGKKEFNNFLKNAIKDKKVFFKNINSKSIGIYSNFYTTSLRQVKREKKKPNLIGYLFKNTQLKQKLNIDKILEKRKILIYNKIKKIIN